MTVKDKVEEAEEVGNGDAVPTPNAAEIQSLLMEICEDTQVAEIEVKIGKFSLHMRRDVAGAAKAAAAPAPMLYAPPVPAFPMSDSMPAAAAAPTAAAAAAESDKPKDEGLQYITSPRVGIIRRGKLYKGKHGRPIVLEGAIVKQGQAVCFLEQLGTNLTIESTSAGEVVEFLVEDGAAVGYNEPLFAVRPSFPGIKKL